MTQQPIEIYLKYAIPHYGYVVIVDVWKYNGEKAYCVRIHIDNHDWTYNEYKTIKGAKNAVNRIIKEYEFDYELSEKMIDSVYYG